MTFDSEYSTSWRNRLSKRLLLIALVLAGAGLADATYLTVEHYRGAIPTCGLTGGCEAVLTSRWSAVGPVPIALLGSVFYAVVFLLTMAAWESTSGREVVWLQRLVTVAFAVTLVLLALQAFVIGSWCAYCLFSAVMVSLLLAVVSFVRYRMRWLSG